MFITRLRRWYFHHWCRKNRELWLAAHPAEWLQVPRFALPLFATSASTLDDGRATIRWKLEREVRLACGVKVCSQIVERQKLWRDEPTGAYTVTQARVCPLSKQCQSS